MVWGMARQSDQKLARRPEEAVGHPLALPEERAGSDERMATRPGPHSGQPPTGLPFRCQALV